MKSKSRVARSQEEIRIAILTAAKEYISRYGIAKTTVDDIAQAVNMAKSSLYYYFTSKEDIFKAVFDEEFQKFKTSIDEAVALAETPAEKIRAYSVARFHAFNKLSIFHAETKDSNYRIAFSISQMYRRICTCWKKRMERVIIFSSREVMTYLSFFQDQ